MFLFVEILTADLEEEDATNSMKPVGTCGSMTHDTHPEHSKKLLVNSCDGVAHPSQMEQLLDGLARQAMSSADVEVAHLPST